MAENNPANPNTNPTEGNPNNQQAAVTTPPSDEKKYSEDEMNGISKKNSEKAVSKLLKELGITDKEKAKSILQKAAEEEAAQQASTGNDNVSEQLRSELAAERAEKERAMLETVFLTEKVDPAKISKAVRLIDLDDCRDDEKKFDSIPSAIKAAFNSAISFVEKGINWIVGKVNTLSFTVPSWVPSIGGSRFGFNLSYVTIPRLAKGGIVNNPGKGQHIIAGEAGAEAVLPLETNTEWMNILAEKIAEKISIPIVNKFYVDGKEVHTSYNKSQERFNFATNGGVL